MIIFDVEFFFFFFLSLEVIGIKELAKESALVRFLFNLTAERSKTAVFEGEMTSARLNRHHW